MEPFLIYLLKASGITMLFLVCYLLFLKQETFFKTNRVYLLLGLGMAIFLPFLIFTKTIWVEPMPMRQIQFPDQIMAVPPVETPGDWTSLMLYGYCTGALFFAFRFVIQLFSLKKLIGNGKKIRDGKFMRIETDQKSSPFSFFNYLVYNPTLHTPGELGTILMHEKIHAEGKHSLDIIVMHLLTVFQWCNPFIWLYKACLAENLEYLADNETIAKNATKTEYQYLLLRTVMGENRFPLATPFFNASIKKRIVMLNKSRSHRKNSFKYAMILPLLAGFIFLFNVQTEAQVRSLDSIQEDTDKYGPVTFDKERSGDFPSINIRTRINSTDSNNTISITKNLQSQFYIGDPVPLYIVDGKEISKTELQKINPNSIEYINVFKGQQAIDIYGEKGKNGVVVITLKKNYLNSPKTNYSDSLKIHAGSTSANRNNAGLDIGPANPLYVLDGKEVSKSYFEKLGPETFESINVLKGPKAIEKYGDKGKDGVIEVKTKSKWKVGVGLNHSDPNWNVLEYYQQMEKIAPSESHFPDIGKALILINGVPSSKKDLKSINADQIKMFFPISAGDKDAIKKYGDKAKYGVIEVNTKGPQKW